MDRENDIRLIAYHIWEEEGCPDGKDWEHWIRAEAIWEVDNRKKPAVTRTRKAAVLKAKTAARKAKTPAKKSTKK